MSYWGNGADDCDYAFDAVSAYILLIKERMLTDIATVIGKAYPEQSIAASLACLRQIGERFPRELDVGFRRKDLQRAREGFDQWYALVGDKLPSERKAAILAEAKREFDLLEDQLRR